MLYQVGVAAKIYEEIYHAETLSISILQLKIKNIRKLGKQMVEGA
jgi:hypothetical protein